MTNDERDRILRNLRGEFPRRDEAGLENRIRELENEVAFLKGKIEGMRFVPLPVQPEYEGQRFCPPVPSTKKPWVPPYEVTYINRAGTAIGSWKVSGNPIDIIGPERK